MKILTGRVTILIIIILLIICILILVNERNKYEKIEIGEFDLILSFGEYGRDSIDTFSGTISKTYQGGGTAATDFRLSDRQRKRLLEMLNEMDIMSYPADLDIELYNTVTVEYLNLRINMKGNEHNVSWTIPGDYSFMTEGRLSVLHKRFLELVLYIQEMVYSSDEYKSLPGSEGGYL